MKRLHVHISVENIEQSLSFYSSLFGTRPTVVKGDYAKWMLEDPRVNFAISTRSAKRGVDHLGIQVESQGELAAVTQRLGAAKTALQKQEGTTCCYAKSTKAWVSDPQGIPWEAFYTYGDSTVYGEDSHAGDHSRNASGGTTAPRACCVG